MGRSKSKYQRKRVSSNIASLNNVVRQIEALAKSGATIDPQVFHPPIKQHKGKSRDLPMVDQALRSALNSYLYLRVQQSQVLKPSDPLFITQKGGPYSQNTLQEHMGLMLKNWAGVEKASSHSGRRSVITHVIHKQEKFGEGSPENSRPCLSIDHIDLRRASGRRAFQ